ncbi:MAG: hypothetical protein WC829_10345 [Hyphomicrobium sp.]
MIDLLALTFSAPAALPKLGFLPPPPASGIDIAPRHAPTEVLAKPFAARHRMRNFCMSVQLRRDLNQKRSIAFTRAKSDRRDLNLRQFKVFCDELIGKFSLTRIGSFAAPK